MVVSASPPLPFEAGRSRVLRALGLSVLTPSVLTPSQPPATPEGQPVPPKPRLSYGRISDADRSGEAICNGL